MKQFFKFTFASMLGFLLAGFLVFIIFIGILVSAVSMGKKETVVVPEKTVIVLTLDQPVSERSSDNPLAHLNFSRPDMSSQLGLNDIVKNINRAAADSKVKGIYLELSDIPSGQATIEEIRNALIDFKKSGKFIFAYAEVFTQKSYYLASVADKIYLNPAGGMEFKGMVGQVMFFKGLLDKIDVEAQVIRHGKFKSAIEPFTLDKMSEPNKVQTLTFISGMWNHMLEGISASRKIPVDDLNAIANEYKIQTPQDAVSQKMVDKLLYKDQVLDELKSRLDVKNTKDLKFMKIGKYAHAPYSEGSSSQDKIAVIYATGDIISGEGNEETIGSETISKAIRKARLDDNVKAVVLRVNSPGGSALASDVIWREMVLTKKAKPVVVSMGDVAASGGYYISCAADKIYAYPNTITGSIGVFGIIPNLKEMFNKNLGITFDEVKTNPYADYIPVTRPMNDAEKKIITRDIENIYSTFTTHVSEGRKMTVAQVDSIGQGRVWSGIDAKRIGLIDEFGGLNDAIKEAARLAKLKSFRTQELPEQKDTFQQLIETFTGDNTRVSLRKELGAAYPYYKYLSRMSRMQGIQALMPYEFDIK
ncbi:MAG TPA: signal peptide peptidase SppA [Bacteroidales bacterium]|nr:signal peptide peptidase SppA [Bacteroidales bacterium]